MEITKNSPRQQSCHTDSCTPTCFRLLCVCGQSHWLALCFIFPCPDLRGIQIPFPACPRWLACPPSLATPLFSQAHRESPTRDRQGGPATGPVICCARRKKRLAESFLFCRGPRAFGVFTGARRDCGQGHFDESDRRDFFSACG